jgi:archaellin
LSVGASGTTLTVAGESRIQGVKETYTSVTPSSGVVTVDLNTTTVVLLTLNASVTSFTINNLTAGKANSFTIVTIPNGGVFTITWTFGVVGVKWPGGTAPTLTTTNDKYDVFSFIYDGSRWYGFIGGQNF